MLEIIPLSDFGDPDPYFRNKVSEGRTLKDILQELRTDIESIEISPFLHPNVEEYVYRVLNTYLHGWFYYPLFSIAENLSIFNLEQALKVRYEFQSGARTTLNELLRQASNSGLLRFEQTEAVRKVYEFRKEEIPILKEMGFPVREPNINDIAKNRKKLITENLPAIRGYIVHPTIPSLTMPHNALTGIKQHIEYINIISKNSDTELRKLMNSVDFNWGSARYVPSGETSMTFSRRKQFSNRSKIAMKEIEHFIDEVALFLGLEERCSVDQLWVLSRYTLVPSKAYRLLDDIFRRTSEEDEIMLSDTSSLAEIVKFEDYCTGQLQNLRTSFSLESEGKVRVQFDKIQTSKTRKQWKVKTDSRQNCSVKRHEYSYHILNKLSLHSNSENSLRWHFGILGKVISGVRSARTD